MSNTPTKGDGHLEPILDPRTLVRGTVLRMINSDGSIAPFSDCVVVRTTQMAYVDLKRPYSGGCECKACRWPA